MPAKRKPGRWVALVCLLGLALVVYARLTPFDWQWGGRVPLERISLAPLNFRDPPLNVLLVIPLGFGLAGVLSRGGRRSGVLPRLLLMGLLLSTALEAAQLFLPERVPSPADIAANGVGLVLGYALYRAWEIGLGVTLRRYVTGRNLAFGLVLYIVGAGLFTEYLYRSARLSNWDTSFPLVVGNEAVGKRQWSGEISRLMMEAQCNGRVVSLAAYDFAGEAPYENAAEGEQAPPLVWREGPATPPAGDGVSLGAGEWLATVEPFGRFSEAARDCSRIVVQSTVATVDPTQRGPARIISLSADAERRNLTIGQERDALIIRLRTPASGENGQKPELLVPGVFADGRRRDITVEYDAPMLRVTADGEEHALSLAPGLAFFPNFATENRRQVRMTGEPRRYDWAYWGLLAGVAVLVFGGAAVAGAAARWRGGVATNPRRQ